MGSMPYAKRRRFPSHGDASQKRGNEGFHCGIHLPHSPLRNIGIQDLGSHKAYYELIAICSKPINGCG